ncbi:hypothetical protein GCM10023168_37210 [Fodinibacter luteus]|uniref:Lipoprotein n=1 Tax=Fodinibacter luteus TaxID=552064 RepID=A0ABP8KT19_9MICO
MPATTAALVALASLSLAGCGADVERAGAARAADAFTASATADPGAACAVLAPRTLERLEEDGHCARALATAGLPEAGARGQVSVAGHSAQVRYASDTVFLSLFADGWRVTAAGCRDRSADDAVPYDCIVDGG